MKLKHATFIITIIFAASIAHAQDDLLAELNETLDTAPQIAESTFKDTRIINGHSIELRRPGTLVFMISHRFGQINSGAYDLYGLDQSRIRFALEYAPVKNLMIGMGRSSFEKTYDGYVKYKFLSQQSGQKNIPLSVAWLSSVALKTQHRSDAFDASFTQKLAFNHQLLIARKITPKLSLQLTPTVIAYNLIETNETGGTVVALGIGGRYKLTNRLTINAEYFPQLQDKGSEYKDAIAVGVDIETGGHVFQLHLTNATSMIEKGFIGENTNNFFEGDINFGFNISRTFQLKKE